VHFYSIPKSKFNAMKNIFSMLLFVGAGFIFNQVSAQESKPEQTGLPGDNLNLVSVLHLFQQSETLEIFEKRLNEENSKVNNLDLNGDNKTDYIRVVDNANGDVHAIALKVDLNDKETQDVAVIEVEKDKNNRIHVQVVGDESMYGKDYIIEAGKDDKAGGTPNPGYVGNDKSGSDQSPANYVPNQEPSYDNSNDYAVQPVERWVVVNYLFLPTYVVYSSPFYWGYYPPYWSPWAPFYYYDYYLFPRPYYHYYHHVHYYNAPRAHDYYMPRRSRSSIFDDRVKQGAYQNTYTHNPVNVPGPRPSNHPSETPRHIINEPAATPRPTPGQATPRLEPRTSGPKQQTPRANPRPSAPRQQSPDASPRPSAPRQQSPRVSPRPSAPRQQTPRVSPQSPAPRQSAPNRREGTGDK
jgi:hypothetical protein